MATFTGKGSGTTGGPSYTLKLDVWENNYDISQNKSNVGWSLKLSSTNYSFSQWSISTYVNVDGQVYSASPQLSIGTYSEITLATGNKDIWHDTDGTKIINCSASIDNKGAYYLPGRAECSGSLRLTDIPRVSQVSLSKNNINISDNVTIYTNRKSSNFSHKIFFDYYDLHILIAQNVGDNFTWNTVNNKDALYSKIPNNNISWGTIILETYNGGTLIGSTPARLDLNVVNSNPVFSNFTYLDTNTNTTGITSNNQILIQNNSNLQVTVPIANKAVGQNYATITKYQAVTNGITVEKAYSVSSNVVLDIGKVNTNGSISLVVKAIDSRGNATPVTKNITIIQYQDPVLNVNVARLNNFENQTTIKISGSISLVTINSVDKNSIQLIRYRYKEANGTYGTYTNLTPTMNKENFTCPDKILNLDNSKKFIIEVSIQDKIKTILREIEVGIGIPTFFMAEDGTFEINGKEILDYDVISTW